MSGALVLFSGGQDSATCLAWALDRFDHVETIGFDYGQRHRAELDARTVVLDRIRALKDWGDKLGEDRILNLGVLGEISDTALTQDVEIVTAASGLPNTFVPGRNLLFLTFAAAIAYRRGLKHVVTGVCETDYSGYAISVGDGFGVKYAGGVSEVMYIGRGVFSNRIRSHLHNWIFDMSRSLRDVSFRFYMGSIGDKRSPESFKDFEHFLLDQFREKFGEKPLLNKYAGREGRIAHEFNGDWNAPMNNRGKNYQWEIRPTEKNAWFKYYEDE